ncbi:DNA polymerase gamma, partial [Thamnocephalis sphaerospora]
MTSQRSAVSVADRVLALGTRMSQLGIQLLVPDLWKQLFGHEGRPAEEHVKEEIDVAVDHLKQQGIWGKPAEPVPNTTLPLPALEGRSIDEHFHNIGNWFAEPYLSLAKQAANIRHLPPLPKRWDAAPGWTRYTADGQCEAVPYPLEKTLMFDVETLLHESNHAVLACAASADAWYGWVSPWLSGDSLDKEHLIPLGGGPDADARVVIGHHVSFDRARVLDEYSIRESRTAFLDTMSLHVAVSGLCTRQRSGWVKFSKAMDEQDEDYLRENHEMMKYFDVSSVNSLKEVARFHCGINIDKSRRDIFVDGSLSEVRSNFQDLMQYCATDVAATHVVYRKVFRMFLKKCPHPVSFAGIVQMGRTFLPVDEHWPRYIAQAENMYREQSMQVGQKLYELALAALKQENPQEDPWLRQLDWTTEPVRYTKGRLKKDGNYAKGFEPRPVARQFMPGYPRWYRDLCDRTTKLPKLTTRTRVAPLLLKLKWNDYPLYYSKLHGWTFRVPRDAGFVTLKSEDAEEIALAAAEYEPIPDEDVGGIYYRIPHKDGEEARCGNPLAKNYVNALEDGLMSSEYPLAREALMMNTSCAYWISARERVRSQFVVWDEKTPKDLNDHIPKIIPLMQGSVEEKDTKPHTTNGMIIPQIATMGTITRRAVEATWMTASNAKKNRIGSELKAMVRAPPGYRIIGADVDSEELWISSLIGDSQFRSHGATAFGWMTLQGSKSEGTDMHSKTANILGISRDQAKIFNYGRIYGAGLRFATQLLLQFNPDLPEAEARKRAEDLYAATKGSKWRGLVAFDKPFWFGGSESYVFNALEEIATSKSPRTPVLGCSITNALQPKYTEKQFMTSRVNWVVQSSGVDYLHLLLTSMAYLVEKYGIDARFMLSVHDEIRYLVKEEDQYRAALALQISNLWTRAIFSYKLGINDLPQSVAFFSCVDIDHVLRKEVDMSCVTPSNPVPIPPGEKYTMEELLAK